jgi:hypothetical protein
LRNENEAKEKKATIYQKLSELNDYNIIVYILGNCGHTMYHFFLGGYQSVRFNGNYDVYYGDMNQTDYKGFTTTCIDKKIYIEYDEFMKTPVCQYPISQRIQTLTK